jgi:anti-anti-sigma factor
MPQNVHVTIKTEPVDLLTVAGDLDLDGIGQLQKWLDDMLDAGARLLVADLSRVAGCDGRLFDLLARSHHMLDCRGGWLRLVGLGPSVLAALDQAALPEVLLVYRASRWAVHAIG